MKQEFPGVKSMNLLIVGQDSDYNNQDQVVKTRGRSDMLMVAHIDLSNNTVRMLSIPRDTRADIPDHGLRQINSAFHLGGPELCAQTITTNYGIPIDHYAALDFEGFEQAIDHLNGVTLAVDKKMDYDDNWGHLHIHLLPGMQHLSGQQAMGFVRFRHSDTDQIRTHRQQTLLAALKEKAFDPRVFIKTPQIVNDVDKNIESDLTDKQKLALASFVRSAPKSNVSMETLPSNNKGRYVYADWDKATPLIQAWFGVSPPTREHHRRSQIAERLP
jgi:LCP family protein required for cell wall assembly